MCIGANLQDEHPHPVLAQDQPCVKEAASAVHALTPQKNASQSSA